jgi:hypothetical protein
MDAVSKELLEAQIKAEVLFAEVVDRGLVSAGKLESELTAPSLAQADRPRWTQYTADVPR